jgi:eukaryotic-like serine/threonine-protein kinase
MEDATHPGSECASLTDEHVSEAGTSIGRYVVLEEIRHGELGRALRAYDPKLQREVVLECVHTDRSTRKRLVAEARALARLSHPDVVAVYDVDEIDDEWIVLVTEHVPGQTLAQWRKAGRRSWRDIVACFRAAARGLAAAHAAGLAHRDFDLHAVIVGKDGRVRVSGIGFARGSGDAASDRHAFCVALHDALRPAGAPRVPPWLVRILERGLAIDPRDRWPSMDALLVALSHDPSRRRRRWLQATAGIGVLALGAVEVQAWASARAQQCTPAAAAARLEGTWDDDVRARARAAVLAVDAPYAKRAWAQSERTLDAHAAAWTQMHVDVCEATTLRQEQSAAVMDLRMACLHRARVEMSAVTRLLARADAKTVQKAHELTAGLRSLDRCADVDALHADVEPPRTEEADAVDAIRASLADARAAARAGHYDEAQRAVDSATEMTHAITYGPVQTELALVRGFLFDHLGDYDRAHDELREALALASRWRQWEEMEMASSALLYVVGYRRQQFAEGLSYADVARGLAETDAEREARVSSSLAIVLAAQANHEEAEAELRRALELRERVLGPHHPDVATTHNNLANVLNARGDHAAAEAEHRRALALREDLLGPDHPDVAMSRNNLAAVLHERGEYAEAEAEHRKVLALREAVLGRNHPDVAQSRNNLGVALEAQGKYAEAEVEHRRALALREDLLGAHHPLVALSRKNLGEVLFSLGAYDDAEAELRRALADWESTLGAEHPHVALARKSLARVVDARGAMSSRSE